ncbi:LysM peptidoglycan-binding domain-containing protein [bacterium]|nr:LysM peptidoglycan-binding domain-containing protein [bacterium]
MKWTSSLWQSPVIRLTVLTAAAGCGPMWYGPPPPTGPVGQNPPTLIQPTPVMPGQTWSPTPGASSARDLGAVPDVPADQVLQLPKSGGSSSSTWHEVRQGETLTSIAQKYGVSVDALREANYFESGTSISTGQLLLIPKRQ